MLITKNKSFTFIGLALTVLGIVACSPQNIPKTSDQDNCSLC